MFCVDVCVCILCTPDLTLKKNICSFQTTEQRQRPRAYVPAWGLKMKIVLMCWGSSIDERQLTSLPVKWSDQEERKKGAARWVVQFKPLLLQLLNAGSSESLQTVRLCKRRGCAQTRRRLFGHWTTAAGLSKWVRLCKCALPPASVGPFLIQFSGRQSLQLHVADIYITPERLRAVESFVKEGFLDKAVFELTSMCFDENEKRTSNGTHLQGRTPTADVHT